MIGLLLLLGDEQLDDPAAGHLLGRVLRHLGHAGVHVHDLVLEVGYDQPLAKRFNGRAEAGLRLAQLLLCLMALADVADGDEIEGAIGQLGFGDDHLHREQRAVGALAQRLPCRAVEELGWKGRRRRGRRGATVSREQHVDGLPKQLGAVVAKKRLGGRVDREDRLILGRQRDDGVSGGPEQRDLRERLAQGLTHGSKARGHQHLPGGMIRQKAFSVPLDPHTLTASSGLG